MHYLNGMHDCLVLNTVIDAIFANIASRVCLVSRVRENPPSELFTIHFTVNIRNILLP